jgi:ADP-ribose pyrophosphatase YjhB (NUDIX family)
MGAKAKLIIIHNDKLLLLKPLKRDKFSLIGGNVDNGETPIKAAIRESKEEAGLKIKKRQLIFFMAV